MYNQNQRTVYKIFPCNITKNINRMLPNIKYFIMQNL